MLSCAGFNLFKFSRLSDADQSRAWNQYRSFTSLIIAGGLLGAVAWLCYMTSISANFTAQQFFKEGPNSSLKTTQQFGETYLWNGIYFFEPLTFGCLTVSKLMVLDRIFKFNSRTITDDVKSQFERFLTRSLRLVLFLNIIVVVAAWTSMGLWHRSYELQIDLASQYSKNVTNPDAFCSSRYDCARPAFCSCCLRRGACCAFGARVAVHLFRRTFHRSIVCVRQNVRGSNSFCWNRFANLLQFFDRPRVFFASIALATCREHSAVCVLFLHRPLCLQRHVCFVPSSDRNAATAQSSATALNARTSFLLSAIGSPSIAHCLCILFPLTRVLIAGWTLLPSLWLQPLWFPSL